MLLSIDGTFLVQLLNFVLFWTLLNYAFIRPTRRAIEERQRFVAGQYREAEGLRSRAAALRAQADALIGDARRRTDELMRDAAARASVATSDIERKATEEAAASVALAHATVAAERTQATEKQGPFVSELARAMMQRALDAESVA
jgi:F-type H+-transporting ATPase subunit b